MIRAITALTLAVGMCLSTAAFAAPAAPKANVVHVQKKAKLAPGKSMKKVVVVKRQPRGHDKMLRRKIPLRAHIAPRTLRTSNLQRVK